MESFTEIERRDLTNALEEIRRLARPGQTLGISEAIDLICDIYNVADQVLPAKAKS